MDKKTTQGSARFLSPLQRLAVAAGVLAGLMPFAAFGASCKNEGSWRDKSSLFDPTLKVKIGARAADSSDGWKVQTRGYFIKAGEGTYVAVETDSSSLGLGAGNSVLWPARELELTYNDGSKKIATFNQYRVDFAAGNGATVACAVTLQGRLSSDVDHQAKFDGVKCTADGSDIPDLDNNAYVSCKRSFKNSANRFEVVLTLLDQD